jgi:endoglucanase
VIRSSSPRHSRRVVAVAGLGAGVVVVGVMAFILLSRHEATSPAGDPQAIAAARRFLARYVDPTGRVVRLDQGSDTVSEGQSYALVLAQLAGDETTFKRVWDWTAAHLLRPDGLLASHADATHVIDTSPAADADVVTAWALLKAGGDRAAAYHGAGRRMASAVLARETVAPGGRPLLAAGPWATGSPATLNPSYWVLPAYAGLARTTGDRRWTQLAAAVPGVVGTLSSGGAALPPDWARVDGTTISATSSPNGQPSQVQYGLDAQRLVVWLAAGCDPAARRLAAGWWPKLSSAGASQALALRPDGGVVAAGPSPLALVATAAAADAAGRPADRDRLLDQASAAESAHPSYYSAAWVALGRGLVHGSIAGGCTGQGVER